MKGLLLTTMVEMVCYNGSLDGHRPPAPAQSLVTHHHGCSNYISRSFCLYKMRIYFINLKTGFFYIWFIVSIGKYFVDSVYEGSSGWLLFSLICVDFCTLCGIPVMAYFYSSAIMSTIHTSKYFKFFTLHLFGFWFCSQYLLALCKNVWHVLFV